MFLAAPSCESIAAYLNLNPAILALILMKRWGLFDAYYPSVKEFAPIYFAHESIYFGNETLA